MLINTSTTRLKFKSSLKKFNKTSYLKNLHENTHTVPVMFMGVLKVSLSLMSLLKGCYILI